MKQQPALVHLLSCPNCGNDEGFYEVISNIVSTTLFIQNDDGSFSPEGRERQTPGSTRLFCAVCDADLTAFHHRFSQMIF